MNETVIYVDKEHGKLLSVDVKEDNSFIVYTDNNQVIAEEKILTLDIAIKFPIIRLIDSDNFLLADGRTSNEYPNAHIFDYNGKLITSFLAGDGIEDIVIHNKRIVVTYFDEGVFGQDGPNNNGLSVFSLNGKFQFGFNESAGGLSIADCYCICKRDKNKILFYAYDLFNVIELNLDDFNWKEFKTPDDFKGASAITTIENKIIFHSSYHDKQSFFMWDVKKDEVVKVGEYSSHLKGVENGKFFSIR